MNDRDKVTILTSGVAGVGGLGLVVFGFWALFAPASFFEVLATFEPYNEHFVRDVGAFQIGLGAVLLLAARWRDRGIAVALTGVGIGMVFHVLSHTLDRDLGGRPMVDIPGLSVLAVVLLAAAVPAWRRGQASPARREDAAP